MEIMIVANAEAYKEVRRQRVCFTEKTFHRNFWRDVVPEPNWLVSSYWDEYNNRIEAGLYYMGWHIDEKTGLASPEGLMFTTRDEWVKLACDDSLMWRSANIWATELRRLYVHLVQEEAFSRPIAKDLNGFIEFYQEFFLP